VPGSISVSSKDGNNVAKFDVDLDSQPVASGTALPSPATVVDKAAQALLLHKPEKPPFMLDGIELKPENFQISAYKSGGTNNICLHSREKSSLSSIGSPKVRLDIIELSRGGDIAFRVYDFRSANVDMGPKIFKALYPILKEEPSVIESVGNEFLDSLPAKHAARLQNGYASTDTLPIN